MIRGHRIAVLAAVLLLALISGCGSREGSGMEPLGPDVEATMVIYFRLGTTEDRVGSLNDQILWADRPDGRGKETLHKTRIYVRLLPSQANGHEAIALTFQPTATREDIDAVRDGFLAAPEVLTIFENVAPNQIKPKDVPQDRTP